VKEIIKPRELTMFGFNGPKTFGAAVVAAAIFLAHFFFGLRKAEADFRRAN
jgi:hypothetical protein